MYRPKSPTNIQKNNSNTSPSHTRKKTVINNQNVVCPTNNKNRQKMHNYIQSIKA